MKMCKDITLDMLLTSTSVVSVCILVLGARNLSMMKLFATCRGYMFVFWPFSMRFENPACSDQAVDAKQEAESTNCKCGMTMESDLRWPAIRSSEDREYRRPFE